MKILYRVDEDNITGTGHLMELVTLHKALAQDGVEAHACTNGSQLARQRLADVGVGVFHHVPVGDEDKELAAMREVVAGGDYDAVVCDLLDRTPAYYEGVRGMARTSVVILDDGEMREIDADVCVNFSILQDQEFYRAAAAYDTDYWIGPDFFPFGEGILALRRERSEPSAEVSTLFVNQGGTDPYGLTAKTLKALERIAPDCRTVVVVGGGLTEHHLREFEEVRAGLKGAYDFYSNIPMERMHALMAESDAALTAAGNTLYELACLGVPSAVISHHEKHDRVARAFASREAVLNMGIGSRLSAEDMASGIEGFLSDAKARRELGNNIRAITKTDGISRLASYLKEKAR